MIVGEATLGADALAAVGATATIVYFVLCFIQGLTGGCGILLGQAFGAGNEKQVRESVSASVWISALFTIVLTVLCCSTGASDSADVKHAGGYLRPDVYLPVYYLSGKRRYGLL